MTQLDLSVFEPWLRSCGFCDAGLAMSCTHPDGDYRVPMAMLVAEVERLRRDAGESHPAIDRVDAPHTITGRRHPATSSAAADRVYIRTGTARRRVLEAIAVRDSTDEELQTTLAMSPNTERPRRLELVQLGLVKASIERRRSASGNWSTVWTVTDSGQLALGRRK